MSRTDTVENVAYRIATDLFICTLNPEYRGENFDYTSFDIERHVCALLGSNLPWVPTTRQINHALTHARQTWDRWIETIGSGLPEGKPC